jgi:cohesin complex subunit SA-1/2
VPLLTSAIGAVNTLCRSAVGPASALSASNDKKLSELSEALFTSLRDALAGEDIAVITLEEDLLATVQAVMLRLTLLAKARDVSKEMMDNEGDQTTAWDICCAFVERAGLGYKEEAQVCTSLSARIGESNAGLTE